VRVDVVRDEKKREWTGGSHEKGGDLLRKSKSRKRTDGGQVMAEAGTKKRRWGGKQEERQTVEGYKQKIGRQPVRKVHATRKTNVITGRGLGVNHGNRTVRKP